MCHQWIGSQMKAVFLENIFLIYTIKTYLHKIKCSYRDCKEVDRATNTIPYKIKLIVGNVSPTSKYETL